MSAVCLRCFYVLSAFFGGVKWWWQDGPRQQSRPYRVTAAITQTLAMCFRLYFLIGDLRRHSCVRKLYKHVFSQRQALYLVLYIVVLCLVFDVQTSLGSVDCFTYYASSPVIHSKSCFLYCFTQHMENNPSTFVGPRLLTEEDIPGSSLSGRRPATLKNNELQFWLRCRGDSCKGLRANVCKNRATCGHNSKGNPPWNFVPK